MHRTWAWGGVILAVVAATLMGAWWNSATAQSTPAVTLPVGVVNMVRVFNDCEQTTAIKDRLSAERAGLEAEANQRKEKIAAKEKELDAYHPDSPEWTKCSEEMLQLQTSANVWAKMEEARVARVEKHWVEKNYNDITDAVAAVAKEHGLALVLMREELDLDIPDANRLRLQIINRKVVYYDPQLDVTDAVLKKVNETFKVRGGVDSLR
ncbi:MAG: OmpH family outer membrane protein [Phycisphaerae bacterium]|nr:OmpH family outer membrane protein [Phycisphaerae bacterium]